MAKSIEMNIKQDDGSYEVLYPITTFSSVIGGPLIELVVTGSEGTSLVATCNEKSVQGAIGSTGTAILGLDQYGEWTLTSSYNGITLSRPIQVDTVKKYFIDVNISSFSDMSWEINSQLLEQGHTELYSVGEYKTFILNGVAGTMSFDNTQAYATIIGINHNSSREGNNRLHLQISLNNNNTMMLGSEQMNTSNTNNGGWGSSYMRNTILAQLFDCLPTDLQAVVKNTTKYTSAGNESTNIVSTSDRLFLLSEFEIFGNTTYSVSGERNYQQRYSWYSNHSSIKYNSSNSASPWWERSPYQSNSSYFCIVGDNGDASYYGAGGSRGVAPCLCI